MNEYNYKYFLIGKEGNRRLIRIQAEKYRTYIGSETTCDEIIIGNGIKPRHCSVSPYKDKAFIKNLAEGARISVNGTFITCNDKERLIHNDQVTLGTLEFQFYVIKTEVPTIDLEKPTATVKPTIRPSQSRRSASRSSRQTGRVN